MGTHLLPWMSLLQSQLKLWLQSKKPDESRYRKITGKAKLNKNNGRLPSTHSKFSKHWQALKSVSDMITILAIVDEGLRVADKEQSSRQLFESKVLIANKILHHIKNLYSKTDIYSFLFFFCVMTWTMTDRFRLPVSEKYIPQRYYYNISYSK